MGKVKDLGRPDRTHWTRGSLPLLILGPTFLTLFSSIGCTGVKSALAPDPLLGGPGLKPGPQTAPQTPAPVTVLPPPAPNSATSNAALAAGVPRPFDNSHDLRIGTPRGTRGIDGWAVQGPEPRGNGSGAVLQPPEPAVEPVVRQEPAAINSVGRIGNPSYTVSQDNSRPATYEQAQAQLKARGVIWQKLEAVGDTGEWKFSCSLPNRQNPKLRRTYEARARDHLAAIRAVLEQLDREQ